MVMRLLINSDITQRGENNFYQSFRTIDIWLTDGIIDKEHEHIIGVEVDPQKNGKCKDGKFMGLCKDCKYFEYDGVAKVDGIPLIVAHEICSKWGDGCKTTEGGYCFLFEPLEEIEEENDEK